MQPNQLLKRALLLAAVVTMAACVSLEQAAPPVERLAVPAASAQHSKLALGREIYITRCAKCHTPEPVTKYSVSHWHEVIGEMSQKTNLTAAESDAVLSYVLRVHQVAAKSRE